VSGYRVRRREKVLSELADASPATHALPIDRGVPRRRPFLRLQRDERLVDLIRAGDKRAFETLFARYRPRLLAFCRGMVGSTEDAEDVLQEVFASAHRAMLADAREIAVKPWLYRIARNRCLNHLRRPTIEASEELESESHQNGASTADHAEHRDELRGLLETIGELPETQRSALLLREVDDLSYEEIARALTTTVPAVKSLLVRARMALAVASQARELSCGEVQVELAEAAEGLRKASDPARHHLRHCPQCEAYRAHLRSTTRELGLLLPLGIFGPIVLVKRLFGLKASGGGAGAGAGSAGGSLTATSGGIGLAGTKTIATVAVTTLIGAGASHAPAPGHTPEHQLPDAIAALAEPELVAAAPAGTPSSSGVEDRTIPRTHSEPPAREEPAAPAKPAAEEPAPSADEPTTDETTTATTENPYSSSDPPADDSDSSTDSEDTRSPLTRIGFSTPAAVRHWRTTHSTYYSGDAEEDETDPPPPQPTDPPDPPDPPPPTDDGESGGDRGPGGET
jgi:RNA polymerase sigma factor (sigma-70 family)